MRPKTTDEELLRSYLLGTLPEEDADPLEDRLLREDELFELSEAMEADLLAACDRGEFAPEERERVLRRLASSPQGRERFALARSLNAAADTPAPVVAFPRRPPSRPYQWLALAASLLMTVGLSWYAVDRQHGGESSPLTPRERETPTSAVTSDLPLPPLPPPPPIAQESRPPVATPKPAKVVCQLALMTLRGGSEPAKQLRVPPDAGVVEFQIGVEGMEDLESFHVVLRSPKGGTLLNKRGVQPKTLNGVRTLVVELPASRLSAGQYEIETQGIAPGSEPEDLSPLSIEVVRSSKR